MSTIAPSHMKLYSPTYPLRPKPPELVSKPLPSKAADIIAKFCLSSSSFALNVGASSGVKNKRFFICGSISTFSRSVSSSNDVLCDTHDLGVNECVKYDRQYFLNMSIVTVFSEL